MGGEDDLRALGCLGRVFGDDGKHGGVQAGFRFVYGDEWWRIGIAQHGHEEQEPYGAVGEVEHGLLALEGLPADTQLHELIRRWRKDEAVEVVAERRTHGGVDVVFEVSVFGIEGVEDVDEVLAVRMNICFVTRY